MLEDIKILTERIKTLLTRYLSFETRQMSTVFP